MHSKGSGCEQHVDRMDRTESEQGREEEPMSTTNCCRSWTGGIVDSGDDNVLVGARRSLSGSVDPQGTCSSPDDACGRPLLCDGGCGDRPPTPARLDAVRADDAPTECPVARDLDRAHGEGGEGDLGAIRGQDLDVAAPLKKRRKRRRELKKSVEVVAVFDKILARRLRAGERDDMRRDVCLGWLCVSPS